LSGAGLWLLASARLYRARVSSVRTIEMTRLARVSVLLALLAVLVQSVRGGDAHVLRTALGGGASLVLLTIFRSGFRSWLQGRRRDGRFVRPVVIVGANEDAVEIHRLLTAHPELGFRVVGVVGERDDARRNGLAPLWRGPAEAAVAAVADTGASGAVVVATALPGSVLNRTTRELVRRGTHVQLTNGLRGIDHRRLRAQPLAYEPLYYLEPPRLTRLQLGAKRALDVGVTFLALLLSLPVLGLAALAVKVGDGGPVLFRQRRVGRDGREFTILKLRTMVPDAEQRLIDLRDANERDGPLFKLSHDPRITPVGRWLRACSLDELPQLLNVLRGDMSLVGPRPALPSEVADFDEQLLARTDVLPGITGLWQVEARDNPSFATYRRLDLFYVENWSVTLDLVILFATVEAELARLLRAVLRRRPAEAIAGPTPATVVLD
jgi:exopolysaccharide biosynthesis polyprenyl glycosylphosphotransferase